MLPLHPLSPFRSYGVGTILGAWTVAIIAAITTAVGGVCGAAQWSNLALNQSLQLGTWALLTPGIFWMTRLSMLSWRRFALAQMGGVAAVLGVMSVARPVIHNFALHPVDERHALAGWIGTSFIQHAQFDVLVYASLLAVGMAFTQYRRMQERGRRPAALEAELTKAQLQIVQAQVNPHFLFNALNTISSSTEGNPAKTRRLLAGLSSLLRRSLDSPPVAEIPLAEELAFVRRYLDIMQTRHGERLQIEVDVPASVRTALVPSFSLQPLVENAIEHGISRISRSGLVRINANRENRMLVISVEDNGPGLDEVASGTERSAIGLSNVRSRLYQLYGSAASLTMSNRLDEWALREEGGLLGVRASMRLPYREHTSNGRPQYHTVDSGA